MLKIKNGSSFKKPLYLNDLFGNEIKKEIELKWQLNENGSGIKIKMEVHSINQYTLTIYLEIK